MKAVVAQVGGGLQIVDVAPTPPGPGEVQLRMTHGGICGSDLHYEQEGRVGNFVVREPLILGHEVVGEVLDDPAGTWPVGTRVGVHPAYRCGECPECRSGNPQVCRHARYLGSAASDPQTNGGFAETLTVRADQLRRLPEELPLSRAVLAEPLGVALHGLNRAGDVAGRKVLVTGSGPIGLLTVGALKARGAAEIWATDMLEHPLALARQMGADQTVRIGQDDLPELEFDVALECSGAPRGLSSALKAVRRRGVVVQVGSLPGGEISVELGTMPSRETDLRGAFRFNTEIDEAIEILTRGPELEPVITHTFGLAEAEEAFALAHDPSRSGKVVLELS